MHEVLYHANAHPGLKLRELAQLFLLGTISVDDGLLGILHVPHSYIDGH